MKVTLEKNYKDYYTLTDLERAKAIIRYEKDDNETAKGWAEYAVREALKGTDDGLERVLEASAETARNCNAWNLYGDTADMDVWVRAIAKTQHGFIEIGAYLSDIWQTGENFYYKDRMYIEYFTKRHN